MAKKPGRPKGSANKKSPNDVQLLRDNKIEFRINSELKKVFQQLLENRRDTTSDVLNKLVANYILTRARFDIVERNRHLIDNA